MNDALVRRRIGPALVALGLDVTELCRHLMETNNAAGRGIAIVTHASPTTAAVETVVPIGLLLNELLTNSLKHGFPDGRRGAITVSLAPDTDGHSVLSVADDGVGFAADTDPMNGASLGLRLVRSLAAQTGRTVAIRQGGGVHTTVRFPIGRDTAAVAAA